MSNALIWTKHIWKTDPNLSSGSSFMIKQHIMGNEKLSREAKDVLLNYPVVYIHTWNNKNRAYIGETIDILRRTEEHSRQPDKHESDWHDEWKAAEDRVSYYFSSRDMNKSLALDLEDCLIKLFKEADVSSRNGRENFQGAYSNKPCRDDLLKNICAVLQQDLPSVHFCPPQVGETLGNLSNALVKFQHKIIALESDAAIIQDINNRIQDSWPTDSSLLLNYPVVYMLIWTSINGKCHVYTGETNNFLERTKQHLETDWKSAVCSGGAQLLVFGHKEFNKSMTLDIENRLIQYTIFLSAKGEIVPVNKRTNEQNLYDNRDIMFSIFQDIVEVLNKDVSDKFMLLKEVMEQSIFMASPLMKLTDGQESAKNDILRMIDSALAFSQKTLLIVHGKAGTGKTVLLSNLFFHLLGSKNLNHTDVTTYFVVNHKELFNAYTTQSKTWQLGQANTKKGSNIFEAENLINCLKKQKISSPDILLIDEGHLLYTRGTQGGIKGSQLPELLSYAKVTVLVFDEMQFVDSAKRWEPKESWKNIPDAFRDYLKNPELNIQEYPLRDQLRMLCDPTTKSWLDSITRFGGAIETFPSGAIRKKYTRTFESETAHFVTDTMGYEIGIFATLEALTAAIEEKKKNGQIPSCLLSTYNWDYNPKNPGLTVADALPWHATGKLSSMSNNLWTLQTSMEVGSIHDIQGFDLNYAGVIIGPSVCYNTSAQYPGISFNPKKHNGLHNRNKDSKDATELISNELGVLLSRGIQGVYLYATDKKLRNALIKAVEEDKY